jgi:hypothetical protein
MLKERFKLDSEREFYPKNRRAITKKGKQKGPQVEGEIEKSRMDVKCSTDLAGRPKWGERGAQTDPAKSISLSRRDLDSY